MEKDKGLNKIESFFYVFLSAMTLSIFTTFLARRLILHIVAGPIILTVYFIISLFFVLLLILALKKSLTARYIFMQFSIILILLFIVEVFLRLIDFPATVRYRNHQLSRNRLQSLISLREKGLRAMPNMSADSLIKFSKEYNTDLYMSNVSNSYIVGDAEDDGVIIYQSDANGFRNSQGMYENTDSFDVLLLGDSFAEGCWVPQGYTIPDYIAKETGLSVYNTGLGGTGLISQLAIFLEYGLNKQPRNIIQVITESATLVRALNELNDSKLKRYFTDLKPNNLLGKNSEKEALLKKAVDVEYLRSLLKYEEDNLKRPQKHFFLKGFIKDSKILLLIQSAMQNYRGEGYPDCKKVMQAMDMVEKIFQYYQESTKKYGGSFCVVYLPSTRFYFKAWPDCERKTLSSLCVKLNIPFLDMAEVFNKFENPKFFFAHNHYIPTIDGHCNRKGYELVAKEIIKQIK